MATNHGLPGPRSGGEPKSQNLPRFAMLNRKKFKSKGGTLFTIAFFGRGADPTQPGSVASEEVSIRINEVRKLAEKARSVEVLFVLDGTESMVHYFEPVAKAVGQFAEKMNDRSRDDRKGEGHEIRFAAAVYSDYERLDAKTVAWEMVAPFGLFNDASNLDDLMERAKKQQEKGEAFLADPVGGRPEAAFAALVAAIDAAQWSPQSELRMVVWIGDHGNHEKDDGLLTDPYTAETVAKRLEERKIAFVPISVRGRYYDSVMNKRFLTQGQKIIDVAGVPFFGPYKTYSDDVEEDVDAVVGTVVEALEHVMSVSDVIPERIRKLELGQETPSLPSPEVDSAREEVSGGFGGELDPAAARFARDWFKMFEREGQSIGDVYKLRQAVTDGFVFHRDGSADWSFWVAMEPGDTFDSLWFTIRGLCRGLGKSDIRPSLQAAFRRLTEVMGGDPYKPGETIPQYLKRILDLPVEYFPTLLNNEMDRLVHWAADPANKAEKTALRKQVCKSAWLLTQVERNRRIDPDKLEYDEKRGTWKPIDGFKAHDFDWDWGLVNGVTYTFLPVTYLPKDQ